MLWLIPITCISIGIALQVLGLVGDVAWTESALQVSGPITPQSNATTVGAIATNSTNSKATTSTTTTTTNDYAVSPKSGLSKVELEQRYSKYHYRAPKPRSTTPFQYSQTECGSAPDFSTFFQLSDQFRSFRNEDKRIYEIFFQDDIFPSSSTHQSEGVIANDTHSTTTTTTTTTTTFTTTTMPTTTHTYVELGAFNGNRESNSRFFDHCLGWTGLLIEANPKKYSKLLENRPYAHCLNYAPSCPTPSTIDFHSVSFTNAAQANVPNFYDNTSLIQVPCDQLTTPLIDVLGGHVSFFSLDVEGAEDQILSTVQFDQIQVDIWMVENTNHFCPKQQDCPSRNKARSILVQAGYVGYPSVVLGSDIFVRPNSIYDIKLKTYMDSSFRNSHRMVADGK